MKKSIVLDSEAGQRLDKYVVKLINNPNISRSAILKSIPKYVKVNEKVKSKGYMLKAGDTVKLDSKIEEIINEEGDEILPIKGELEILDETKDYIVLNKQKGVPVHPGKGHKTDTIANFLKYYLQFKNEYDDQLKRGGIVHRLDKDVSGLLICAKNLETQKFLQTQFEEGKVTKLYLGRLESISKPLINTDYAFDMEFNKFQTSGIDKRWIKVEGFIKRDISNRKRMQLSYDETKNSRYSLTYVLPLKDNEALICIKTGRMHQIRATLRNIGWVVLNDALYGSRSYTKSIGIELSQIYLKLNVNTKRVGEWKLV